MKIKANRDEVLKPLLRVSSVVERRQTLPILANVLIEGSRDRLRFTATDLEVELSASGPIQGEGEIEFTLPARKLVDICKALPEGASIELEVSAEKVTLRSGRARFTMGTLPAQDYPSIEPSAATDRLRVPQSVLKRLIEKTAFSMAHQDVRYYLNGLLLEISGNRVRAVATDGHRLAVCDAVQETGVENELQVILPRKAVLELGRLLEDADDEVELEVSNSHVRLRGVDTVFTTKLIDGRFPDYERVVPTGATQEMLAAKEELKQALARTSILSNENYRGIRFRLAPGTLHLQAHNPEQDEAEEELQVEYAGNPLTIGFNVGYLLDVLGVLSGEQVRMALIDADSSCLVTAAESSDCRYVIMPMRL
ncbi:MAG: DNA polymerase III subunit beta [Gammaproteobacteria bacterium]|nr:MAG: DNA polymerase III subunit beta [Gammaproteobacteria bacterium]